MHALSKFYYYLLLNHFNLSNIISIVTNLNLVQYPESEVKQSKEIKDEVFKLKKKMEELKQQKKETTKNS